MNDIDKFTIKLTDGSYFDIEREFNSDNIIDSCIASFHAAVEIPDAVLDAFETVACCLYMEGFSAVDDKIIVALDTAWDGLSDRYRTR